MTTHYKFKGMLAALVVVCGGSLASAADMNVPLKASPPATQLPAAFNWSGWYVGGNVGYGWGASSDPNLSFVDGGFGLTGYFAAGGNVTPNLKPRGVLGGGEIGANWTPVPNWVLGFVTDLQASGMKNSATNFVMPPGGFVPTNQFNSENIDWFGTVRGKLGFAQNNWLFYGTGGLAYGRVATSGSLISPTVAVVNFAGSTSSTRTGWTAGGGVNYGLSSNWIVGVEYLYVDLGRLAYTELNPLALATSITINNRAAAQIVRASLDYKF